MKKILDLGCGRNKYKEEGAEVIGVDLNPDYQQDVIHDLNVYPYPFKNKSFDIVRLSYIIEHVKDRDRCLKECLRIAKKEVWIRVPHFSSRSAWGSPDHKGPFSITSFDFYFSDDRYQYFFKLPGSVKKRKLYYDLTLMDDRKNLLCNIINKVMDFLANLNPYFCERFWCYWVGGFREIEFVIEVNNFENTNINSKFKLKENDKKQESKIKETIKKLTTKTQLNNIKKEFI